MQVEGQIIKHYNNAHSENCIEATSCLVFSQQSLSICVCVCVSSTAKVEHHCLFAGSQEDSEDQATLIVGVVIGLLVAAAVVGLIYWLYMKNSRYGKTTLAFGIYICHSRHNSRWCCSCSCKPTAHFKQEKRGDFVLPPANLENAREE